LKVRLSQETTVEKGTLTAFIISKLGFEHFVSKPFGARRLCTEHSGFVLERSFSCHTISTVRNTSLQAQAVVYDFSNWTSRKRTR